MYFYTQLLCIMYFSRCIQIRNLHKVYTSKKASCCAVNSLQMTLYENQILALLGNLLSIYFVLWGIYCILNDSQVWSCLFISCFLGELYQGLSRHGSHSDFILGNQFLSTSDLSITLLTLIALSIILIHCQSAPYYLLDILLLNVNTSLVKIFNSLSIILPCQKFLWSDQCHCHVGLLVLYRHNVY